MDVKVSRISQKMKMSWLSIVGTPSPLIKGMGGGQWGRTFKKLSHLGGGGGVPKIWLERGDKPEKWGLM